MPAAVAAWCAGQQGQFWGMHDLLFDNQTHLADSDLAGYASSLGLDLTAWQSCIADSAATAAVTADLDFGLQIGVQYTPTFLINGIPLVGNEDYAVFTDVVDEALTTAQADGTPQASYYDHEVATVGCQ
jgi:protein-disulfide isomerase